MEKRPLIEYIVLVEFDINQGSTTRIQYPKPVPNVEPQLFADNMLPERADKFGVLHTFFTVNRKPPSELLADFSRTLQTPVLLQSRLLKPFQIQ